MITAQDIINQIRKRQSDPSESASTVSPPRSKIDPMSILRAIRMRSDGINAEEWPYMVQIDQNNCDRAADWCAERFGEFKIHWNKSGPLFFFKTDEHIPEFILTWK